MEQERGDQKMDKPFTRKELTRGNLQVITRGRWGNADLYKFSWENEDWVVKDFSPCSPVVREVWGRFLIQREFLALSRLQGIAGIPAAPFLLDRYALCYHFIPGGTLKETRAEQIPDDFFFHLEALVLKMHQRQMVHLDLRNRRNILITNDKTPGLLDFQSSLNLANTPRAFHGLLKDIDISGVYKMWSKRKPASFDAPRRARLESINRKRSLWFLKGYMLGTRSDRRS